MASFRLRDNFLLGVATAATQIEGGDNNNNWSDWASRGLISDGSSPLRANDHYNRWHEDVELMKTLGLQVYRMGLEWSRIEPEQGCFDEAAIAHYREEIEAIIAAGMKPLLTLHHFSNPLWFERMGAFEHDDSVAVFLRFAKTVIRSLGDIVSEYITINEPNVYATFGYFYGQWPPGHKSFRRAMRVMSRLAECHIRTYEMIHHLRSDMGMTDTKVSFAHHMRVFDPASPGNPIHRLGARLTARLFQDIVDAAMMTGDFKLPLRRPRDISRGRYYDFIGINYYTRSTVRNFGDGVREAAPINDLGWEIYPEGLIRCVSSMYKKYQAPIYITENGTCDNNDSFRARYIFEHLQQIAASDLPIERYYHWCFCDNFEWIEGESARFGLVHIDFETQQRTLKKSADFYRRLIAAQGVDEDLFREFVAGQDYQHNSNSIRGER